MRFRPACAAVALIGTSLLLLTGIRCAQAGEIQIVSPSSYKDREGEGLFGGDSEPPYRYQQVFPAADFAALGNQPHWIVGFAPRADHSVTSPRTAHLPDNEVRLSTTQLGPNDWNPVFDDNHGSNVMQFYSGSLTMVADVAGPGPGPREFYHADFPAGVTPFLYDPSQGNLLFDFIAWQGESPRIVADQIPGIQTVVGDPFATEGVQGAAAIFQFTLVPLTPGDYNHNGTLDAADINELAAAIRAGATDAKYDVDGDAAVTDTDRVYWVKSLKNSWIGDANLDGQFNSSDLVAVFQIGQYEDAVAGNSGWGEGDWNGDANFDSSDFVAAFQDGGFESGPRAAVSAVPEPSAASLCLLGLLASLARRRSSVSRKP